MPRSVVRLGICSRLFIVSPLLVGFGGSWAAEKKPPAPQVWWPDPDTGLMWTGTPAGGAGVDYPHALAGSAGLTFGGYTGWRLPAKAEFEAITHL